MFENIDFDDEYHCERRAYMYDFLQHPVSKPCYASFLNALEECNIDVNVKEFQHCDLLCKYIDLLLLYFKESIPNELKTFAKRKTLSHHVREYYSLIQKRTQKQQLHVELQKVSLDAYGMWSNAHERPKLVYPSKSVIDAMFALRDQTQEAHWDPECIGNTLRACSNEDISQACIDSIFYHRLPRVVLDETSVAKRFRVFVVEYAQWRSVVVDEIVEGKEVRATDTVYAGNGSTIVLPYKYSIAYSLDI